MKERKTDKKQGAEQSKGPTPASPFAAKPETQPLETILDKICSYILTLSERQKELGENQKTLNGCQKGLADNQTVLAGNQATLNSNQQVLLDGIGDLPEYRERLDRLEAKIDRILEALEVSEYETVRRSLQIGGGMT